MRGCLAAALLALLCATSGAAADPRPAPPAAAEIAGELISRRHFKEAEALLRYRLASSSVVSRQHPALLYLLALALAGQRQHAAAAETLRDLLARHPRHTAARAALGRMLFLQGRDAAARRQFDLVLADAGAAAEIRASARRHLAAIRRRNGWILSSSFSLRESDNVNNAPDSDAAVLIAGLPFTSNIRRERGLRAAWSASADHRRRLGRRLQWESGAAVSGGIAPGALDSSIGAQLRAGPRFLFGDSALGVTAFAGYQWSGGHPSSNSCGMRAAYQTALAPGGRAFASLQRVWQNHISDDERDAKIIDLQTGLEFPLSRAAAANLRLTATDSRARRPLYSYFSAGAQAGLQHDFPYGVTAGGAFAISRALYGGASALTGYRQRDVVRALSFSLLKRDWRIAGFAPKLTFTRSIKRSNIATSEYENNTIGLEFSRNF